MMADTPVRTQWTLTIPTPGPFLTSNFRGDKYARARLVKAWRDTTYRIACGHKPKLPKGLTRIRVDVVLHVTSNRGRDLSNHPDAAKPSIDALSKPFIRLGKRPASAPGYLMVANDTEEFVDGPHVSFAEELVPHAFMVLTITDLSAEVSL